MVFVRRLPKTLLRTTSLLCLVLLFIYYHRWNPTAAPPLSQLGVPSSTIPAARPSLDSKLKLIIPATQADSMLCKTLVSVGVLGYPTPCLVNFGKTFPHLAVGSKDGTHLGKIPGVLSKLQEFGADQDSQLLLIVDGLDTWFQVDPSVLLSRYHAINHRASERTSLGICGKLSCEGVSDAAHVSQQIIFGCQKRCAPEKDDPDHLSCTAPPPSTLPENVFGRDTDKPWPDEDYPVMKMRPRFLNSGFVMGPVAALRRLYEDADRRMQVDLHKGSDQSIFMDIFAEQEYARRLVRTAFVQQQPLLQRCWWRLRQSWTMYDDEIKISSSAGVPSVTSSDKDGLRKLEHGISLDYFSELSHTTVFAHRDADWIVHSQPDRPSTHWQIVSPAVAEFSLPDDVRTMLQHRRASDWSRTPMLTNLYTGIVPASVHHNAWQHGMKSFIWTMWPHMWWYNESQPLTCVFKDQNGDEAKSDQKVPPLTVSSAGSAHPRKAHVVNLDNGTESTLQDLCGEFFPLFELDVHLEQQ